MYIDAKELDLNLLEEKGEEAGSRGISYMYINLIWPREMISRVSRLRAVTLLKDVTSETRHRCWKVEPFLPYIREEIHEAVGERRAASLHSPFLPFSFSLPIDARPGDKERK